MVLRKRSRSVSRRSVRRPAKRTRRMVRRRGPRSSMRGVTTHHFRRGGGTTTYQGSVTSPLVQAYTAFFSNITNSSEFTSLYDQYKLNSVVVKFYFRRTQDAQAAASADMPKLWWYRDVDDNAPPSTLNEIRERANHKCVVLSSNRPVVVKFKPNVLTEVFRTGLTTSYQPKFGVWLDMSTTDVPHYGFKFAIDNFTNPNYFVDIETVHYFSCRNPR